MSGIFRSIVSLGFEGVSIQSTSMFPNPAPTDEDKMVILLSDGDSQQLESIAKSFYQAGVLTLIVSTTTIDKLNGICDAMTVSHIESMPFIVKSLLEPIIKQGKINYDFNDLYNTLHNTEKFKIESAISRNNENRIAELDRLFKCIYILKVREFYPKAAFKCSQTITKKNRKNCGNRLKI